RGKPAGSDRNTPPGTVPAPAPPPPPEPLRRRHSPPPVKQPAEAELFVALPPAPHVPITDADNLRRLPPGDLLGHSPQNHFLYFHRPLRRGLRVGNHAPHGLLPSPPAKRTHHLLTQPDISCANDNPAASACSLFPAVVT